MSSTFELLKDIERDTRKGPVINVKSTKYNKNGR